MAMIQCPECNQPLSDQAYTCPHCGYPIKDLLHPEILETRVHYEEISCSRWSIESLRWTGYVDIIAGIILAFATSFHDVGVNRSDIEFDILNFGLILTASLVSGFLLLSIANTSEKVENIEQILTTLRLYTQKNDDHNKQTAYVPPVRPWTCKNCNSINSAHSPVCDICGTPKPGASSAQPPSNASVPRRRTQVQGWHCPECGTENSLDTEKCTRCGYAE